MKKDKEPHCYLKLN